MYFLLNLCYTIIQICYYCVDAASKLRYITVFVTKEQFPLVKFSNIVSFNVASVEGCVIMQYIAILCSNEIEFAAVRGLMKSEARSVRHHGVQIIIGDFAGMPCLVVLCGTGKVNAARTAQLVAEKYKLWGMISAGVSGALNPALNAGDVIYAKRCVQADFDLSILGHEQGFVPQVGKHFISAGFLFNGAKKYEGLTLAKLFNRREGHSVTAPIVREGNIATLDTIICAPSDKRRIYKEFAADCDDLCGAAIAQVCRFCVVPFIAIRAISDKPTGENQELYYRRQELAAINCAQFIHRLIADMKKEAGNAQ